jgi:hypothetical protein
MIVSDFISACKSNYHAITITTAPFKCKRCTSPLIICNWQIQPLRNHIQMSISTGWECSVFTPRNWLSSNRIPHSYCTMKRSNKIVVFIQMCSICSEFEPRSWRGVLDTTLCDEACQWLATCRWFSRDNPVSTTNKTDRDDIAEILLKVALNTINQTKTNLNLILSWCFYVSSIFLLCVFYLYSLMCPSNIDVLVKLTISIVNRCVWYTHMVSPPLSPCNCLCCFAVYKMPREEIIVNFITGHFHWIYCTRKTAEIKS